MCPKTGQNRDDRPYSDRLLVNGDMGPAEVQTLCDIDEAGKNLMRMVIAWESRRKQRAASPTLPRSLPPRRHTHGFLQGWNIQKVRT